jgi:selenoprotein W-related protein
LRDEIVEVLGNKVEDFKLVPSRGGCFELKVDGKLVYSKLATGQFPIREELIESLIATSAA